MHVLSVPSDLLAPSVASALPDAPMLSALVADIGIPPCPDMLLRLRAEMRLPGKAWLEFHLRPLEDQSTEILQTAWFEPHGVSGRLYWWAMWPFHRLLFDNMIRKIGETAVKESVT